VSRGSGAGPGITPPAGTVPQRPERGTRPARRGRRWLLAAVLTLLCAGLAVAGILGAARYVSTFWLYRGFAAPTLPRTIVVHRHGMTQRVPVIPATVRQIGVASPALGGYRDPVDVVLPPGYADHPDRRYPVLYLLHGFPGDPSSFLTVGGVQDTAAELVAAGQMQPMILVIPSGTRSFLADEEWVNSVQPGNDWETFVARDLVSAIDARYRTVPGGTGRGIAGLSEGGYAALNIGLHHPGEFRLVESWSGYMRADRLRGLFDDSPWLLTYNSPADTVGTVAPQLRADRTYIWFYSGTDDYLTGQNRAFAADLSALGLPHRYFTWPGTHNWRLWRALLPEALIAASEHLGHG
jgi:enterochelin esterase-like enzyme